MIARFLALLLGLLVAGVASAAEVRLQIDVEQLQEGQRTGFDVVLEGAKPRNVPEVRTEAGLAATYVGQSQTTSIVNGHVQQYVKFRFEVVALREGPWTLGPAYVRVDEGAGRTRTLTAEPVKVVVAPAAKDGGVPGWVELTTEFDRETAWQGQVVLYHAVLRTRKSIAGAGWFGQPQANLLAPKDGRPEHREYVVRDGRGDVLVDESSTPYVVTASGSLTWPAPALQVDVVADGSFGILRRTHSEVVTGSPLSLRVKPLPPPPPGFSGLVGDFQLQSHVERTRARVGESIDWQIALDGDGALDGYTLEPPGDLDGMRIYEGAARPRAQVRQGRYTAGLTFDRTLVPTREGTFDLPTVKVIAFSPSAGDYVTLTSPAATLHVTKGEGVGVDVQSFAGDTPLASEPAPEGPRPLRRRGPGLRLPWDAVMPVALGLAALPATIVWGSRGVLAALALARRRRRSETRQATPLERLDHLPSDPDARLMALDAALRLALARADDVEVTALDRSGAISRLPVDVAGEASLVARALDRARFAGIAAPPDLEQRLRSVVAALEGEAA